MMYICITIELKPQKQGCQCIYTCIAESWARWSRWWRWTRAWRSKSWSLRLTARRRWRASRPASRTSNSRLTPGSPTIRSYTHIDRGVSHRQKVPWTKSPMLFFDRGGQQAPSLKLRQKWHGTLCSWDLLFSSLFTSLGLGSGLYKLGIFRGLVGRRHCREIFN